MSISIYAQEGTSENRKLESSSEKEKTSWYQEIIIQMKDKMAQKIEELNPLNELTPEDVKGYYSEKSKGTYFEKIFTKWPKTLDFAAELTLDKPALKGLAAIPFNTAKWMQFFWGFLFLLFLFWFIGRVIDRKTKSILKSIFLRFCIRIVHFALLLFWFYKTFEPELEPTINLVKKVF